MVKYCISIILIFNTIHSQAQSKIAIEIYEKICNSLFLDKAKRPTLLIRNVTTSGASYSKLNHTIYIDQKLIDAFASNKEFQSNAVSFVIGHELAHALEKDKHNTDFLAYDKSSEATYQNEQNADIQGAFIAYISGFNVLPTITETIEILYKSYHLDAQLKGYPNKSDRIESIGLIKEQVESLIAIFKSANLLLLSGEYNLAANLFLKLSQYYPSTEVHVNISAAQILEALNLGKYNYYKYVLPLEISWDLRLKKPGLDIGQKEFEPEIIRRRELLLKMADILLKQSLQDDPNSFSIWNNLICLKLIKHETNTISQLIKSALVKFKGKEEKEQFEVLSGINELQQNNLYAAKNHFSGIQSPWLSDIIHQNDSSNHSKSTNKNCVPDIILSSTNYSGTLLQEKKIKLDSLSINWSREKIVISTPALLRSFRIVQIQNPLKCSSTQTLGRSGKRWNKSLISIINPLDNKLVFYEVN